MATPSELSEQVLALPNGAGSVASAGQTFQVRPYNGTGAYHVPIETHPGHAGLKMTLSLAYSTHAGSGIAGVGWSLDLASVERRTDKGLPTFDDEIDRFTLQGDELLPTGGGSYRLRIDSRFARIRHVRKDGDDFWVVTERDGGRVFYGLEPDHRVHDDAGAIAAWRISKKQDANGNEVSYAYVRDAVTRDARLAAVDWAGCYRVAMTYEPRPDPIHSFRRGFEHVQQHRLSAIDVQVKSGGTDAAFHTYRRYSLAYRQSPLTARSILAHVAITGFDADGERHDLPPLTFGYSEPDIARRAWRPIGGALPGGSLCDGNLTLARQSGCGLPDLFETTATGHWLRENLGNGQFASPRRVPAPAQTLLQEPGTFISDMNGDGWGDLVVNGGRRVYRGVVGGGWGAPYPTASAPAVDLEAPDVRVADLNADGQPDALRGGPGSWVFFENLGEGRWAPGAIVPEAPPVRLDDPRVQLTDINGDGLPDLVFTDRHRILVWPGRGRGRFGAAFELRHPPDFGIGFDPRAVRWADLTGSGQSDLLYMRNGLVVMCFNQSGRALSDSVTVMTARQSSHGHVEPVDLHGTGSQGLLLTDHQFQPGAWKYLELFSEGQPDLLTSIDNGLGATTTIAHTSSATYWVADRLAGRPWRSSMPSPQVVVASVTTDDRVTGNRLGVSYRYHHGVFDGAEREFRGFALVEQIDREADPDDPSPVPPALIKRWYHTGANVELRDEFCALPEPALLDIVPELPWAQRSLRGCLRREETYALDGDPRPFSVREIAYHVFAVARATGADRCAFAPLPVRSRVTTIERSDERRMVETITTYDLEAGGGYGLPVEVRERAPGRRGSFSTAHELAQTEDLERFTITRYVNRDLPDPDYRAPYTPGYLVGKPALVERYGVSGSSATLLARERSFYDGEAYMGLGFPGSGTAPGVTRGRLSSRLVWAFTEDLLQAAYPAGSGARAELEARGRFLADGPDRYVQSERYRHDARGMVTGALDPNGGEWRFDHDSEFGLFPTAQTDAAGHRTSITRGRLPFQVAAVLDANGNTTTFTYEPCGLPVSRTVQGKFDGSDWSGDPPTHPTEIYQYDFGATPIRVVTRTRQVRLGATLDVVRYLDGLGRAIQERHTAEPDATGRSRFRVTGWQLFNHRGLVVSKYQPFFSDTDEYGKGDTTSAVTTLAYDAQGRVLRVSYPDGTFETTTYLPWVRTHADRNDNARHIAGNDARYVAFLPTFADHLDTPAKLYVDGLGRDVAEAVHDGSQMHVTRKVLDLKDQLVAVWDGRELAYPTWTFRYDARGLRIGAAHATAIGERHSLCDAAGNPIWARDASGVEVTRTFDALNRPLEELTHDGGSSTLRRQWRYVTFDEHDPGFAGHQAKNLFGRVEEERDADGLRFFEYDWRGLTTKVSHRFWTQADTAGRRWDDPSSELWTTGGRFEPRVPAGDRGTLSYLALPDAATPDTLQCEFVFDTAGRPTETRFPGGMRTLTTYNAAGLIDRIEVDGGTHAGYETIVDSCAYNARGQLTRVMHGNGVESTREYDEAVERLTRTITRAPSIHFQDRSYHYDPVGNPVLIADNLEASSFSHNRIVPNTRTFRYDARYRLTRATGKKHRTVTRRDPDVLVTSPDPNDYEPYSFGYAFDAASNFVANEEYATGPLHYKSGRIDLFNGDESEAASFEEPADGNYRYDANGNCTHTPRHGALAYTHDAQVRYADLNGGGQARFFRHGDQRVVRMVRKNGLRALTVYLGPFEYHLRRGTSSFAKLVLHVAGHGRHAQVERILSGADPHSLPLFFNHPDHLESGHVLTTRDGDLLSQEEYLPYGRASDRRDARNRYRFIGVERDEDMHLCMTGPRTYDPACGRFLQPDPLALERCEWSPYAYASVSPVCRRDQNGYEDTSSDPSSGKTVPPSAGGVAPAEATMPPDSGPAHTMRPDGSLPGPSSAATSRLAGPAAVDSSSPTVLDSSTGNTADVARAKELGTWHANRLQAKVKAWADVENAWNVPEDPLAEENRIRWAISNGADDASDMRHAKELYDVAQRTNNPRLVRAALEIIRDVNAATAIRVAAARAGNQIALIGLHAASDAGLEIATTALAEFALPGAGGAVVGGAWGISALGRGAIIFLPLVDIRDGANLVPEPTPPPPPLPNPEDWGSDQ
jgi:RHS repeat-associated protein